MNTIKPNNVAEAAAQLAGDQSMAAKVEGAIAFNSLVSALLTMRIEKGLTQEQIAQSMHCDPSKVSRLESGNDQQLRWIDILRYAGALKVDMSISFDDSSLPAVERIKQCVYRIDADLENLAALAKEMGSDDEITKEIHRFYKQVLFNFLVRFQKNAEKLSAVIKIPGNAPRPCLPGEPAPVRSPEPVAGLAEGATR